MKSILPLCFLIAIACLSASSCYYDNEEDLYPLDINACDTTIITYESHIQSIMNASCATVGCHIAGGSGTGLLDTYAGVKSKADDGTLFSRTVESLDMPPSAPLSECNLNLITAWINQGAAEN